jgi:uncharacterized protein YgbK (DUF1537 family)
MSESIRNYNTIPLRTEKQVAQAEALYRQMLPKLNKKIVVLDDDPTGGQTLHGIDVFTQWDQDSFNKGFEQDNPMFIILTNSRSMSEEKTQKVHTVIAERILNSAKKTMKDFVLVSRSDSTLRGHYPLETETLKTSIENMSNLRFDGEILCPFFLEGDRLTINGVHYYKEGDVLTPVGQTEFSKDVSFPYTHSRLPEWIEEKTKGAYPASEVKHIPINSLQATHDDLVCEVLMQTTNFNKVVTDAVSYSDIKVFLAGYIKAVNKGKRFLFRSAAAIPKVLGGIKDKPLLTREDLQMNSKNGGLIVVGSHVKKTSRQLENLLYTFPQIVALEFSVEKVLKKNSLEQEKSRLHDVAHDMISKGNTVCIYTSRKYLNVPGSAEEQMKRSIMISDTVTDIVKRLSVKPAFIIAKGGITSSDIAVNGLSVHKALVFGQILPGIPVWLTDEDSKYGKMPYVIFPGNVGQDDTLSKVVTKLI